MTARHSLLLLLGGSITFLIGAVWGVMYGFPAPDANPEEAARLQFHAGVAFWTMLMALMSIAVSVIRLLQLSYRSRASRAQ